MAWDLWGSSYDQGFSISLFYHLSLINFCMFSVIMQSYNLLGCMKFIPFFNDVLLLHVIYWSQLPVMVITQSIPSGSVTSTLAVSLVFF